MEQTHYITIVDDHTMIRKGLSSLINLFPGYRVLFDAANGKDFIAQLNANNIPHIVLLDINMPEMDGYATADWIRTNYEELKILALSTMDSENAIIKMIHHGAKGYVLKDAEPAELKLAFDEVLKKGYYYNDLVTRRIIQSVTKMSGKNEANVFAKLSEREIQFLKLACSEKTYQQIAAELFVSVRTVDGYREALFEKLQVSSRVGMVMYAIKNGLIIL